MPTASSNHSLRRYAALLAAGLTVSVSMVACSPSSRAPDNSPVLGDLRSAEAILGGSEEAKELPPLQTKTAEELREEAIENYRDFIAIAPDGPEKIEATRRVADLQLERAAIGEGGSTDSAALYQGLLEQYPNNPSNDKIYYQLAKAHIFDRNIPAAIATLERLSKRFPNSPIRLEADFRRAELLFENGQYAQAETAYRSVLDLANSDSSFTNTANKRGVRFTDQAQYKLGWALFKQKRYDSALDELHVLLDRKLPRLPDNRILDIDLSGLPVAEQELVEDSLRAASLSLYYKARKNQTLASYLQQRPKRRYESLLYARLADLYLDREQYASAAKTWGIFPARNPLHRQAPLFSDKVIETWQAGGFLNEVLTAKANFVESYDLNSAYWQHFDSDEAPDIIDRVKTHLIDLAEHYHAQAQNPDVSDTLKNYRQAINWYGRYLGNFPSDERAPTQNFLLAEAHEAIGEYETAGREFDRTAYNYAQHAQTTEAGYASVLAYQKHAGRFVPESPDFEPAQRKAIAAALTFAENFPTAEQAPIVLTRAAEDLFTLEDYSSTIDAADRLLSGYPNARADLRQSAWVVTGRSLYELARYPESEQAFNAAWQLAKADLNADPQVVADLEERMAFAIFKQGEAHQTNGESREAIVDFQRLGDVLPNSSLVPKAEYQAAIVLVELQDWSNAAPALAGFRDAYPTNELADEATIQLAEVYEADGQLAPAAAEYLRVSQLGSQTAAVREAAALKSADLYDQTGQAQNAVDSWQAYLQLLPADIPQTIEIRQKIVDAYLGLGNIELATFWRGEILAADQSAGTASTERTKFLAANAALEIGEIRLRDFQAVQIREPLAETAAQKKTLLEDVIYSYTVAAEYNLAEVTTQATYRLGQAYHEFAKALLNSPKPQGLSEEELEEYEILIEEEAEPLEDKAIDLYVANLKRAEQDLANEWVQASYQALTEIAPGIYGKNERTERVFEGLE